MNFRRQRRYEEPEINFIPLIDVLLVILIFLMVTTTYSRFAELEIKLPSSESAVEDQPSEMPILVAVSEKGDLMVGEEKVTDQTLEKALETAATGRDKEKLVVVINADENSTHQSVVRVMEAARRAGLTQLTFATTRNAD